MMKSVGDTGKEQLQKKAEVGIPEMSDKLRRELIGVFQLVAVYELKTENQTARPRPEVDLLDIYIDIPEIETIKKILDEKMPDPPAEATTTGAEEEEGAEEDLFGGEEEEEPRRRRTNRAGRFAEPAPERIRRPGRFELSERNEDKALSGADFVITEGDIDRELDLLLMGEAVDLKTGRDQRPNEQIKFGEGFSEVMQWLKGKAEIDDVSLNLKDLVRAEWNEPKYEKWIQNTRKEMLNALAGELPLMEAATEDDVEEEVRKFLNKYINEVNARAEKILIKYQKSYKDLVQKAIKVPKAVAAKNPTFKKYFKEYQDTLLKIKASMMKKREAWKRSTRTGFTGKEKEAEKSRQRTTRPDLHRSGGIGDMLEEGELVPIVIDFKKAREGELNESFLTMFGGWIETIMKAMFGGSRLPLSVRGSKSEVESFARAIGGEKNYIKSAKRYGLDHPTTYKNKSKLDVAIKGFEKETGIKWPFK